ncbi:MAG: PAS domain-containing sensor histidine kinase [Bacteroidales bacterium]|nr:PAS domain-containing sensor histidine kinase [Bacteroidales bacterium]
MNLNIDNNNLLGNLSKAELIDKISALEKQNKQLNQELKYQEQAQFDWSGNLGKWQWDVKENKVHFNEKKIQALGYNLQEIPEGTGFEFFTSKIHPEDYEMVMQNMRNHLYGVSEAYECEYRIKSRNGEWKWFYDRGIIIKRDADKKPLELVGIVFDISSQKKTQEELKSKNAQLTELNENKSLMLSIIAHDLRGPLGALDSLIAEIKDISSLATKTKMLNEFASSIHNLYSLVNNLLEWAAFQKGEFTLNTEELTVYNVAQLAVDHLKLVSDKKNIRVINNINPQAKASFDEKMVLTVFRNLVSNAIKYTKKNGQIELSDKLLDKKIEITVKDNGLGINEETQKNLFSVSSKKSTIGTDGEKGTGLGLVLCKDFIEKNGGSIGVKSKPGKGSAFTFSLPLKN